MREREGEEIREREREREREKERERERESMLVSKTFNFRITFLDLPFRQQRLKRDKEDGGT